MNWWKTDNYPAVIRFVEDSILVSYPDLEGCITFGVSEEDALYNAKEALEGYIYTLESDHLEIPQPSKIREIELNKSESIVLVDARMPLVRDQERNRSIKKH